ncbi:hypothetical protein [Cohnella nanjingensis]|uniref:hypothetical protein n=1 Tax=Cohnella nanjingensis TaxID=1387779 RepID=UPI001C87F35D|nr:hypothetical protein [Cohnella nanjingensis]
MRRPFGAAVLRCRRMAADVLRWDGLYGRPASVSTAGLPPGPGTSAVVGRLVPAAALLYNSN